MIKLFRRKRRYIHYWVNIGIVKDTTLCGRRVNAGYTTWTIGHITCDDCLKILAEKGGE